MSLTPRTVGALRRYWAGRLGVGTEAFDRGGATVGAVGAGEDDNGDGPAGVELLRQGDALVVGAPPPLVDPFRDREAELAALDVADPVAVREAIVDALSSGASASVHPVDRVLGPAFYGHADAETFEPIESPARPLAESDAEAFETFRAAIPTEDWVNGGPAFRPGRTTGRFVDGGLVAAAGYEVWDGRIAHLAVVVRPDARGEGHGRAVVSRATELAFEAGLIPQYRTLDEWPWSVALAEGLGYERFATSAFVVLD